MRWLGRAAAVLAVLVVAGCGEAPAQRSTPSVLDPKGKGARVIAREIWLQFGVATLVFLIVVSVLVTAVVRSRRNTQSVLDDEGAGMSWIVAGGIVFPVLVLSFLFAFSIHDLAALGKAPRPATLTVQVVGHQWWWEIRYPNLGFSTAGELALPVDTTVELELSSADVIHTFWIPQLQRKADAIPGEMNMSWLSVDHAGSYRGVCTEFCGLEHARMNVLVEAMPAARFAEWAAAQARPAPTAKGMSERAGSRIFQADCGQCHTIRGTAARGDFAPDLTHIASRPAIAGAILPNTRGNLAGWIADPQRVKPGAMMPSTGLTGRQLRNLVDYLEQLR